MAENQKNKTSKISPVKVLLIELKEVIILNSLEKQEVNIRFSGIKRLIYSLWNKGRNERDEDIIYHMTIAARAKYLKLLKKYQYSPKIEIVINLKKSKVIIAKEFYYRKFGKDIKNTFIINEKFKNTTVDVLANAYRFEPNYACYFDPCENANNLGIETFIIVIKRELIIHLNANGINQIIIYSGQNQPEVDRLLDVLITQIDQ